MADIEELPCGCTVNPYRVIQSPKCDKDHEARRKALYEYRERKLWGRLYKGPGR